MTKSTDYDASMTTAVAFTVTRPCTSDSGAFESLSSSTSSFSALKAPATPPPPPYSSTAQRETTVMATEPRRTTIRFKIDKHPARSGEKGSIEVLPVSPTKAKAKTAGKATWRIAKTVVGGAFGCICYILYKTCILDGGSGHGRPVMVQYDDGRYSRNGRRESMYQAEVRGEIYPVPRSRAMPRPQNRTPQTTYARPNVASRRERECIEDATSRPRTP